jgi:DNA-binding response OmpR family regulator
VPQSRVGAKVQCSWRIGSPQTSGTKTCIGEEQVHRKGYIVIVETDDLIRELLQRWLGEAGYAVVASPPDASAVAEPVVLVIVNVSKPRQAGPLIGRLQALYAAPIVVLSGRFRRGLEGSANAASELGVRMVLPKPFTRAGLLAAVHEATKRR